MKFESLNRVIPGSKGLQISRVSFLPPAPPPFFPLLPPSRDRLGLTALFKFNVASLTVKLCYASRRGERLRFFVFCFHSSPTSFFEPFFAARIPETEKKLIRYLSGDFKPFKISRGPGKRRHRNGNYLLKIHAEGKSITDR